MSRPNLVLLIALAALALVVSTSLLDGESGEGIQQIDVAESNDGGEGLASQLIPPASPSEPARSGADENFEPHFPESVGSATIRQFDWRIGERLFSEFDLESMEYDELREVVDVLRDEQYRVNRSFMEEQPWEHYWIPNDEWAIQEPDLQIDADIYLMGRRTESVGGESGMVFVPRGLAPEAYALKEAILEVLNTGAWRASREIEFAEFQESQRERFPDRDLVFEMVPNGVAFRVYEGRIGGQLLNQRTFNIDNSGAR